MKNNSSPRKYIRFITVILVLALLPFLVVLLNKKLSPHRDLASTQVSDSALSVALDTKALKYKILASAKKLNLGQGEFLQLGLARIITDDGFEKGLCEIFPTVDFILSAEGVAVAGEVPQIVVRAPCTADTANEHFISPSIPFADVFTLEPLGAQSAELSWQQTGHKIQIYTRNSASYWPRDWAWTGLRLYGADKNSSLYMDGFEIISVLGEPLFFTISE